jgi:hypothetical protein
MAIRLMVNTGRLIVNPSFCRLYKGQFEFSREGELPMRKLLVASALLAAFCVPALAGGQNGPNGGYGQNGPNGGNGQNIQGAPGPIAGAGLPILAVGYGAYWLVRRYRRKSDNTSS